MTRVILNGCSGRMGTVLTDLIGKTEAMEVVAGIDVFEVPRDYPVFASLEDCTVQADVIIDFSSPKGLKQWLPIAISRKIPCVVATTGLSQEELSQLEDASESIAVFRSGRLNG